MRLPAKQTRAICAANKSQLNIAWEKKGTMLQFTHPKCRNGMLCCWQSRRKFQYKDFNEFGCQFEDRFIFIMMKSKNPVYMVFEVVTCNGDVMPPFILPPGLRFNTEAKIKFLVEVVLPWIERIAAGKLYVWQQGSGSYHTSSTGCQKISATTWLLTSGRLTSQVAIPLVVCGLQLNEKPIKLRSTPMMNWK